ncbi:MAG TPA: glycosyltransferase family 39 protein [Dongiaceae bacterium]|nr:glycosyltransferase family 39 protein [Dongiaceae bacterium]
MTQTDQPLNQSEGLSPAARLIWLLLIVATLYFCYFYNLGVVGFVGPDEPRYAWIARDMAENGDWVTPRLYGKPWFEKPVLYYWSAALSFKCFGVSEATARLPSAVCALLATLSIAWLAWRIYGGETARWVLLLLPTTVGMIGFSHAAATDMPFAGMLTVAMVCAAVILGLLPNIGNSNSSKLFWLILFGIFLGLAVLAKGPAAIILSGGAVLLWAAFAKRWRVAFRCLHPLAIAAFCLTALPWYILCAQRNPDFFHTFIIEHNFKRYLTPEFQHIQPFWFYVPVVLTAFLPWTLILLWSGVLGIQRTRRNGQINSFAILLLCWAGFCLLFFSISKSKLPGYILPALPAMGLLLSRSVVLFSRQSSKSLRLLTLTSAIVALLVSLTLIITGRHFHPSNSTGEAMVAAGCVLLAFALANLILSLIGKNVPYAALCVLPVILLATEFRPLAHPWLWWDPSGRTLAAELAANEIPTDQIYAAAHMKRGQLYSLSFYLHREIVEWDETSAKSGFLLLPSRNCAHFVKAPFACAEQPIALSKSGWFVYRVGNSGSVGGLDGLGGFSGDGRGRYGVDRQPR